MKERIHRILTLAVSVGLIAAALTGAKPTLRPAPAGLYLNLLSGRGISHQPFGVEFAPFVRYLPESGPVTFLMDSIFTPYAKTIDQLYTAQSFLVPRVLNPKPGERAALIYCSSPSMAATRLKMAGYQMAFPVSSGKGVGVRLR